MVLALTPVEVLNWTLASLAAALYLAIVFRGILLASKTSPEKFQGLKVTGNFKVLIILYLFFYLVIKYIELLSGANLLSDSLYLIAQAVVTVGVITKTWDFVKKVKVHAK